MNKRSLGLIEQLTQELARARKDAEYWEIMAMTDDLTGLHNRRLLSRISDTLLNRRDPIKENDTTLLFIDLDDFGQINKRYGDDVGDEALRVLAKGLKKTIRRDDIAIRKGGDEFVVILVGSGEKEASDIVQTRIESLLNGNLMINTGTGFVAIRGSVGVFAYDPSFGPTENIRRADEAMRDMKSSRKAALSAV